MKQIVVAAIAVGIVAACGKSTPSEGALPTEQASASENDAAPKADAKAKKAAQQETTQNEVGMQMEAAAPDANCSGVKGQVAPEGQPVDDILGIRRGMELERVRSILNCTNSGYLVTETDNSVQVNIDKRNRQVPAKVLTGDNGLDQIVVQFAGLPGQEKVVMVARNLEFAEGNEKLFTALVQEIEGKYGVGTKIQDYYNSSNHTGMLLYAGDGQRVGESNSRFNSCKMSPGQSLNSNSAGREGCGLTIVYQVVPAQNNNTLARKLGLVIIDQRQTVQDFKDVQMALDKQQTERAAEEAPIDL